MSRSASAVQDAPLVEQGPGPLCELLEQAMEGLDELERDCLLLVDGHGLGYAQAAGLLDVDESLVAARMESGRARLRQTLLGDVELLGR